MSYPIELPQVGESVTEAIIAKWLTQVGDHVEKYDLLAEVVTDKVNMEFPAPEAGTITEILVEEGATVPMGTVIATMEPDDPNAQPPAHEADDGTAAEPAGAVDRVGEMITGANVGPTGGTFSDAATPAAEAPRSTSRRPVLARPGRGGDRRSRYSPVVMRLAQEHGIDLETVEGTGLGGRITKRDMLAAVQNTGAPQLVREAPADGDRLTEPSPVRKIIAANMVRSWTEIPHAWSTVETDVTDLVALRESQKDGFRERHDVPLTYLTFSVHAVAGALRSNPLVNSSWENGKIRVKAAVNVGVAVAAPDGLVVPVVRDADRMNVGELARAIAPLVDRARDGKLTLDDVRGGTFTVNNTGALGSVWGGAIINYPQAAIINTETIVKRPTVVETPDGDSVAIRSIMNLCLSFDHRVLDGAEASAFIHDVKRGLEQFGPGAEIG